MIMRKYHSDPSNLKLSTTQLSEWRRHSVGPQQIVIGIGLNILYYMDILILKILLRFKNLGERANRIVIEKMKQEEEWENYPPEFECAIMGELMEDPVKLPSGR